MQKRILWSKGMRLTDDTLRTSDDFHDNITHSILPLISDGSFGLIPSPAPFLISARFIQNEMVISRLRCRGITRNGYIADIDFCDSENPRICPRIPLPENHENDFFLLVDVIPDKWDKTDESVCEQSFKYTLIPSNDNIPDTAIPVARIYYDRNWNIDDLHFVPSCLYLSSHKKYDDLLCQFKSIISTIEADLSCNDNPDCKSAKSIFWPVILQIYVRYDTDTSHLSPKMFLADIKKCIGSFYAAFSMDSHIELSEPDKYITYYRTSSDFRNIYDMIMTGLEICSEIREKVAKLKELDVKPAEPVIHSRWKGYNI